MAGQLIRGQPQSAGLAAERGSVIHPGEEPIILPSIRKEIWGSRSFVALPSPPQTAAAQPGAARTLRGPAHEATCQKPVTLFIAPHQFVCGHGQGPYLPVLFSFLFFFLKRMFTFDVYREKLNFATHAHKDVCAIHSELNGNQPSSSGSSAFSTKPFCK